MAKESLKSVNVWQKRRYTKIACFTSYDLMYDTTNMINIIMINMINMLLTKSVVEKLSKGATLYKPSSIVDSHTWCRNLIKSKGHHRGI